MVPDAPEIKFMSLFIYFKKKKNQSLKVEEVNRKDKEDGTKCKSVLPPSESTSLASHRIHRFL